MYPDRTDRALNRRIVEGAARRPGVVSSYVVRRVFSAGVRRNAPRGGSRAPLRTSAELGTAGAEAYKGAVVPLDWKYNAQTHVQGAAPAFYAERRAARASTSRLEVGRGGSCWDRLSLDFLVKLPRPDARRGIVESRPPQAPRRRPRPPLHRAEGLAVPAPRVAPGGGAPLRVDVQTPKRRANNGALLLPRELPLLERAARRAGAGARYRL